MPWTTPTDRTTGYSVTAADWNVVEDNLTFLYGDTGFQVPSLTTGWVNFPGGFNPAGYRKLGTRVYLRGLVQRTSGTAPNIFTLPAGYRPANTTILATTSADLFGEIRVDNAGGVNFQVGTAATWIALDGLHFDTI